MSKRNSEYARQPRDLYETPPGPVEALLDVVQLRGPVWEPACGSGKMVEVLRAHNYETTGSDLPHDFLTMEHCYGNTIITNPPYKKAYEFIKHALHLSSMRAGMVVMLLPCDYDHAISRTDIFRDCPIYEGQVRLLKRITWFQREDGKRPAPSENHTWHVWDWRGQRIEDPWVRYSAWQGK